MISGAARGLRFFDAKLMIATSLRMPTVPHVSKAPKDLKVPKCHKTRYFALAE